MANKGSYGLPGIKTTRTATPRRILKTLDGAILYPGGRVINGSLSRDPLNTGDLDVLRAGMLMGKISSSGKYAPAVIGLLTANAAASATSLTVAATTVTELVRRIGATGTFIMTGVNQNGGTVSSETVTYSAASGTTITCTAITNAHLAGAFIGANDESWHPLGFICDGYGIKVTDEDATALDVPFENMVIGGIIDESQIINLPTDPEQKEWLRAELNKTGQFIFDEVYTGSTLIETPTPTATPTPTPTPT